MVRRAVRDNRTILAVVHRLPNEMLLHIFGYVARRGLDEDEEYDDLGEDTIPPPDAPWEIAGVCRKWRDVALSPACAKLWTRINLLPPDPEDFQNRLHSFSSMVMKQVHRARDHPLSAELILPLDVKDYCAGNGHLAYLWEYTLKTILINVLPRCGILTLNGQLPEDWHLFGDRDYYQRELPKLT